MTAGCHPPPRLPSLYVSQLCRKLGRGARIRPATNDDSGFASWWRRSSRSRRDIVESRLCSETRPDFKSHVSSLVLRFWVVERCGCRWPRTGKQTSKRTTPIFRSRIHDGNRLVESTANTELRWTNLPMSDPSKVEERYRRTFSERCDHYWDHCRVYASLHQKRSKKFPSDNRNNATSSSTVYFEPVIVISNIKRT